MQISPKPPRRASSPKGDLKGFAKKTPHDALKSLESLSSGLTDREAHRRLLSVGENKVGGKVKRSPLVDFILSFGNPLVVLLLLIGVFSYSLGQVVSAFIVSAMAVLSVLITYLQEHRADIAVEKLQALVHTRVTVVRGGTEKQIKLEDVVPGDIIRLHAGDIVPGDCRILESTGLYVNQSALTGESLPGEKSAEGEAKPRSTLMEEPRLLFHGTSVVSGNGTALVIATGNRTQFGVIAARLLEQSEESAFDRGLKQLTYLIIRIIVILSIVIFTVQFLRGDPWSTALLFALAVAVGLTPDMLPMIVTVTLSKGALAMAKRKVIVKRLPAIQDMGAMDVLCTDKTGTLTLDKVVLMRCLDMEGKESDAVLQEAYLNSYYQTGLRGLLDRAILEKEKHHLHGFKKIAEIPFDFERRMMSVVIEQGAQHRLIVKGAPEEIMKHATHYLSKGKLLPLEKSHLKHVLDAEKELGAQGFRVLAVATREITKNAHYGPADEEHLVLHGYLAFLDPPKPSVRETLDELRARGIELKILTGDAEAVTRTVCAEVGLNVSKMMSGEEMDRLSDTALGERACMTQIFTRLSPLQKERVIRALQKSGHRVGYLGDGINDAPALKAADVGISVQNAVGVAKETADIILLQKGLHVLRDGIDEGRRTFGNILKYVRMGLSSNFGNMFSVTAAAILLPFLPMLPIQILLLNFLYNAAQFTVASDDVDADELHHPHPWDIHSIRRFMFVFGPLSSFFDFILFALLLFVFKSSAEEFRTGWFLASLCTQSFVIHIIRTEKLPFIESFPSLPLLLSSFAVTIIGLLFLWSPLAPVFSFVPLVPTLLLSILAVVLVYLMAVELVKRWYVKKWGYA